MLQKSNWTEKRIIHIHTKKLTIVMLGQYKYRLTLVPLGPYIYGFKSDDRRQIMSSKVDPRAEGVTVDIFDIKFQVYCQIKGAN